VTIPLLGKGGVRGGDFYSLPLFPKAEEKE